jgi:AcrR family transcriptional regulator
MSYRDAILEAALTLFAERGFAATTTAEVAEATGAAEGTIFHHFKSKDGLLLAVLEKVRDDVAGVVGDVAAGAASAAGIDLLASVIGVFFLLAETKPRELKLVLRGHTYEVASERPAARALLEQTYESFAGALTEAIALGVEDGTIRPVRPENEAMLVLAMLTGVVRFRLFGLWTSTRSYRDARDLCCRALAAEGAERGDL